MASLCRPLLPLLAALAAISAAPTSAATERTSPDRHEAGREIYNYRCYFCHGYSGDAKTLASTYLRPPPRDFTRSDPPLLAPEAMMDTVRDGKPGTAMHGFSRVLSEDEIAAVVDFVRTEFMLEQRLNTRYHTPANGWPDHDRYRDAFPFATGAIALDAPWDRLSPAQVRGKQLFMTSCMTCHDRARVEDEGEIWSKQSVSYPRNNYSHTRVDAISSASVYAKHDVDPQPVRLSAEAAEGKVLWRQNCAFCHAADGSGNNWIGSFLEPGPRDLTDPGFMRQMTAEILTERIRNGLANTSMPAWKDVLSDAQIARIISYIDAAFHPLAAN